MENTENFPMRKYSKQTATNIYAAPMRVVNKTQQMSTFGTHRPIQWIRPRMQHAAFHDDVMGNHANATTSLNGSEINGYNGTLYFIERKVP